MSMDLHSPDAKAVRQAYAKLDTGVPLVLAPVRLETRVRPGKPERLDIRVYPDQIHLDQHDPALTALERQRGAEYWKAQRATTDPAAQLARWEALAAELGAHRAAYVATATEHGDPSDIPTRGPGRYEGRVRLMPSRWVAFGYQEGEEVFAVVGERIPPTLAMRIDEAGEKAWLTDYATALRLGMALEVELSGPAAGFLDGPNELVVIGIRAGLDPVAGAAELAETLQHHSWTGGLGIAAQGQPTNALAGPTGEAVAVEPTPLPAPVLPAPPPKSDGGRISDRPGPVPDEIPDLPDLPTIKALGDGARLAEALGLADDTLLGSVPHGGDGHIRGMSQMNEVVWPVTLGEMLRTLLAGTDGRHAFPDIDADAAHRFFVDHVRGGGPLPALRVRDQPYGILPVRQLEAASLGFDQRGDLLRLLIGLDGQWRAAVDHVARMDGTGARAGAPADELFIELMSSQPDPWTFATRRLAVRQEVEGWAVLLMMFGIILPTFGLVTFHNVLTARLLQLVQPWDPWIEQVTPLTDPVANYATAFLHRRAVESLRASLVSATQPVDPEDLPDGPFLEVDIDWDACIAICDSLLELIDLHDARLYPLRPRSSDVSGVFPDTHDPAIGFGLFDDAATDWSPGWPVVEDPTAPPEQRAAEYLAALADAARAGGSVLETPGFTDPAVPEPLLAQLARQCVNRAVAGAVSTAVVASALAGLAARAPAELELLLRQSLGTVSYRLDAWYTAVALAELARMRASAAGCELGGYSWVENLERGAPSESDGFVHGPSVTHAITASILRSGWKAHGDENATSALAVDLSSARVRAATELLDGVRQGVALGELLGHRFERFLHDAHLDSWIDPCRRAVLDATGREREAVVGPVDGLVLAGLWDHGAAGNALAAALGSLAEITTALEDLDAAVDSVVDVTTAEAVHQIVQGNLDRAAATFDAVATGQVAPPELDVTATPRRTRAVTHRLAILVSGPSADPDTVMTAPAALGAVAPALDELVVGMLPAPERTVATVELDGRREAVSLDDLGLSGLDAVHVVTADGDTSALVHRVRLAGGRLVGATGDLSIVAVDLEDTSGEADGVSMAEFAVLAASLRRLLATSRPLETTDLDPDAAVPDSADPDDGVADAVARRLEAAHRELTAAMAAERSDAGTLGDALDELARLNVRSALRPLTDDAESWQRIAAGALAEAAQRLARLAATDTAPGQERIGIALGTRIPLPHAVPVPAAISGARAPAAVGQPDAVVPGWLQRLRRTRPQVARFDDVLSAVEVLGTTSPRFDVVQLPPDAAGRWVAESVPQQNTMHLVLAAAGGQEKLATETAGLVVDDWVETIPLGDADSGLAFHFDTPGAEAPQALLLALPPEGADAWSAARLAGTLRSTLAMVRIRAVGPVELAAAAVDDITALGHYVPATNLPEPVRFPVGVGGAS
jgi:hypothetical protein